VKAEDVTELKPREFYRPALSTALESMGYVPADVIRLDYDARGSRPGPCLALTLSGYTLGDLAELAIRVTCYLHDRMDDRLFDAWADTFQDMVRGVRRDGTVVFFPGWTLSV
jgi:hypothetical protein